MSHKHLINSLKESAIDAWMVSEAGYGWMISHGQYIQMGSISGATLSRPSGGSGGGIFAIEGRVESDISEYYQEIFTNIRASIDAIMAPWSRLPSTGRLERALERCSTSVDSYGTQVGVSPGGLIQSSNPNLNEPLDAISLALSDMRGQVINTIEDKLLVKLTRTINAHCIIAQLREAAAEVELSIWNGVTTKLPQIIESVDNGMQAIAANNTASLSAGLGTLKHVVEIVGMIPGPGAKGVQTVGKVFSVIEKTSGIKFWTPVETDTYSELISQLTEGLKNLSKWIAQQENSIATLTSQNLDTIRGDRGSYDLSIPETGAPSNEIAIDPDRIEALINKHLPMLTAELTTIAKTNNRCLLSSALQRDNVGRTASGAGPEIDELSYLLQALTLDLSGEVAEATLTLRTVLSDTISVEQETMDTVAQFLAELDKSRVLDPLSQADSPSSMIPISREIPNLTDLMNGS